MSSSKFHTLPPTTASYPTLGRRILRMSAVWAALGAVVGTSAGMEGGGFIGAVAGMFTGIVELAALGAIFTLIGGQPRDSLVGAGAGLLVGLAVGIVGKPAPVTLVASFGLVYGAMAGATLRSYLRLVALPLILLGRLLRRRQGPEVAVAPHGGVGEHRPLGPIAATNMVFKQRHASVSSE